MPVYKGNHKNLPSLENSLVRFCQTKGYPLIGATVRLHAHASSSGISEPEESAAYFESMPSTTRPALKLAAIRAE